MKEPRDHSTQDIEARLRRYSLSAPSANLRETVLELAGAPVKPPQFEMALRWALAALVVVQVWGGWMERRTGERMARLGAPQAPEISRDAAPGGLKGVGHEVELAILHPRYRLPLGPGIHTTRLDAGRITSTSLSAGDPS
ncbi:MAG: hypothetical protein HZB26_20730 [Candidatus Hydrogenedentes bacterium]|nr:hypothetical protein [Candidatus Hydrogenedentota bacterium]